MTHAITNLIQSDILIPMRPYPYCLKIMQIFSPDQYDGFLTQRVQCDRFDLSDYRQPVFKNRGTYIFIDLYQIGQDVFRNPHTSMGPKYYRKWKPQTGQLALF